jgi:hypothetical protein
MKNVIALSLLLVSNFVNAAEPKALHYQFTNNVVISISGVACEFPEYAEKYKYTAKATRIDGAVLKGCYGPINDSEIQIQWYQGDTTTLKANDFLPHLKATM